MTSLPTSTVGRGERPLHARPNIFRPRVLSTADTVRGCDGDAASVQKASGTTGYIGSSESIASTFFRSIHIGLNTA